MPKKKNQVALLTILLILMILASFILSRKFKPMNKIVTGVSNPGRILIYEWDGFDFKRNAIDVGYKFVHTVRIGDIYNNGKNVIIAGVSNSFYGPPWGCRVEAYIFDGKWKRDIIDDVGDLRCKDLTIGDVDNDGKNEVIVGTHGEGWIKVYKWNGSKWNAQIVERNWIEQVDKLLNVSHRIPREKLTYDFIVQSAVHIVKVGDVDNDGRNELIATISSPLESKAKDISFIKMYKWSGEEWTDFIIDNISGTEFRGIAIGDVYNRGENAMVIGSGVMIYKEGGGFAFIYERKNGEWKKTILEDKINEKNLKPVTIGDPYNKGRNEIVLATGHPNALIYTYEWDGQEFKRRFVGNVSKIFEVYEKNKILTNITQNNMEVRVSDVDNDGRNEIIVGGTTYTKQFGWEATTLGFLIVFKWDGVKWNYKILDSYPVLGMEVGVLT